MVRWVIRCRCFERTLIVQPHRNAHRCGDGRRLTLPLGTHATVEDLLATDLQVVPISPTIDVIAMVYEDPSYSIEIRRDGIMMHYVHPRDHATERIQP